jgi:LuxR family maltose regulon positive regulatory protein
LARPGIHTRTGTGPVRLGLSVEDIERLQMRTEGWPAALYLAALTLRGRSDPSSVIEAFAGDDRHVVDS